MAIVSDPGTDKTYGLNDKISVRLTFNEAMNVDTAGGTPSMKIKMGPLLNELAAAYATGDGTKSLVFRYTAARRTSPPPASR